MPRRQADEDLKPYELRPGVSIPRLMGMNRHDDPAGMPANAHHLIINGRMSGGEINERPGSTEENDSLSGDCITALLETGEAQPAAALWHYADGGYYRESGAETYNSYYAAVDLDLPIDLERSPLAVLTKSGGSPGGPGFTGKVEFELDHQHFRGRTPGAFMFQGKVVAGLLSQITDVKRELDEDNTTGKSQEIISIPNDGGHERVIRQEFDGSDVKDVLYTPSSNAGKIMTYDGVSYSEITIPSATGTFTTMCLVAGQGLCAISSAEVVYQLDPDASWTRVTHSYSDGVYDAAEWNGQVYFAGLTGTNGGTAGTDILKFSPTAGSVSVVESSTAGTVGADEWFARFVSTKWGLFFFRAQEVSGANRLVDIGRITLSGTEVDWINLGFMQDYSGPAGLAEAVNIGDRVFFSMDATEEFQISPKPPDRSNYDSWGMVAEVDPVGEGISLAWYEWGDDVTDPTPAPTSAMAIGPLGVTFG
jgi:hypothetical protein